MRASPVYLQTVFNVVCVKFNLYCIMSENWLMDPYFNVHCSQKASPLKRAWVPQGTFLWIRVPFFVKSPPFLFFVKRMQDKAACFVEHNFSKLKASHLVVFDGQTLCLKVCFNSVSWQYLQVGILQAILDEIKIGPYVPFLLGQGPPFPQNWVPFWSPF